MKTRAVTVIALLCTLPAWVLGIGFCFHTSFDPDVFRKYDWTYFLMLSGWFLITIPLSYLFGRFLFGTQTLRLSGGRTALVRPRMKVPVALCAGIVLAVAADAVVERRVRRHTVTVHTDVFHPFLQNIPRPGRKKYYINEWGFRGEEIAKVKPAGTYRIFAMGGSTVFCGDVDFEDSHPRVLEKRLRAQYPQVRIEVQNAAGDWHSSIHSLIKLLTLVQEFDPDLIIIYHGINDMLRSLTPDAFADDRYRDDYGHFYGAVANYVKPGQSASFLLNMYLGFWFSDLRFDRIRLLGPEGQGVRGARMLFFPKAEPVEIARWRSLPVFERTMGDIVSIAQARGIDVLVANQPYLYRQDLEGLEREIIWFAETHQDDGTKPDMASMIEGMEQFNDASERIARAHGARFVDLDSALPRTLEYFYDDVHYTVTGNEAVAEAFFGAIVEWGVIAGSRGAAEQ